MRITNVRLGFACNSSSSHSLLFLPPGERVAGDDEGDQDYGWGNFTLVTREAKLGYLAQQVRRALEPEVGAEIALICAREWARTDVAPAGYVDHQSTWALPRNWDGKGLNTEFLQDLRTMLLREDVMVLGGNDNNEGHPLAGGGRVIFDLECSNPRVGKRSGPMQWTIFNRTTGAKLRVDLSNGTHPESRSTTPDLVDLKITDYCGYGCSYCYQGSTKRGQHAELGSISFALGEARVFECAIGGGEPTSHPELLSLLGTLRYYGVVPNLTTRNIEWLVAHAAKLQTILGGVAISVDTTDDIKRITTLIDQSSPIRSKITVQHVVGAVNQFDLEDLISAAKQQDLRVTLLGWKRQGRGLQGAPHSVNWRKAVKRAKLHLVSIDTALAREGNIDDVPGVLYDAREGATSCYIDLVTKRIAPSSYCEESFYRPFDPNNLEQAWGSLVEA